ncbi:MAG TPA: hypothetical protein VI854_06955 [Acidimicrobiia bacterium]|nr:hypothetical protein [Acidimicrobiia bacterium]
MHPCGSFVTGKFPNHWPAGCGTDAEYLVYVEWSAPEVPGSVRVDRARLCHPCLLDVWRQVRRDRRQPDMPLRPWMRVDAQRVGPGRWEECQWPSVPPRDPLRCGTLDRHGGYRDDFPDEVPCTALATRRVHMGYDVGSPEDGYFCANCADALYSYSKEWPDTRYGMDLRRRPNFFEIGHLEEAGWVDTAPWSRNRPSL